MINLKAIKPSSEHHNERKKDFDYVKKELTPNNETWKSDDVLSRTKTINKICKEVSGRKLQKNAEPIREAVVLLEPHHTMEDLKSLSDELKERFGMECFQIHIHRDEGHINDKNEWIPNLHAHMVFDYQDKKTGNTLKLSRLDYSQMQTIVAVELRMQRGEIRENSNRERLEAVEYRRKMVEQQNEKLEKQNFVLEQKKNELIDGNRWLRERIDAAKSRTPSFDRNALKSTFNDFSRELTAEDFTQFSEEDLGWAISAIKKSIHSIEQEIKSTKS